MVHLEPEKVFLMILIREKTVKPAFLTVVIKNKVAYRKDNRVYVVPLWCLEN